MDGATLRIALSQPARGVARGQAAVLYDGDTVLGSATISHTSRRSPSNAPPCPDRTRAHGGDRLAADDGC